MTPPRYHAWHLVVVALMCPLSLAASGCQKQPTWDRVPVRGTASLDDDVFSGSLSMRPISGVSGPVATTRVTNGVYAFDTSTGPVRGAHMAIFMPKKQTREHVSIAVEVVVPHQAPFELDIFVQSPKQEPSNDDVPVHVLEEDSPK